MKHYATIILDKMMWGSSFHKSFSMYNKLLYQKKAFL